MSLDEKSHATYSVGVQLMVVAVNASLLRTCDGSPDLSSFSPPSRIGISLIWDKLADRPSSKFRPLLDFFTRDGFIAVAEVFDRSEA